MLHYTDIKHVHLEISSLCNAACPGCPRNLNGYPFNDGYIERNLSLNDVKAIFPEDFVQQLSEIYINGNFGDLAMNKETVSIVRWLKECNPNLQVSASTNGSAGTTKFWEGLGQTGITVNFCIDGATNETHTKYRQNTDYFRIINNARVFMAAGGIAKWKMIRFDHNQSEIAACREAAKTNGFVGFDLLENTRPDIPVFNKQGKLTGTIGTPAIVEFKKVLLSRATDDVLLEDILDGRRPTPISCWSKEKQSIYISSEGDVFPCCFLGFRPTMYGHGNYHQAANAQFKHMVKENNALEFPLRHCINWFNQIEKTWEIDSFEKGRLVICNDNCGSQAK